jgi:hypothetical protein
LLLAGGYPFFILRQERKAREQDEAAVHEQTAN